ncbi:hypothetical protein KUTeg_020437 [Tegillarca granosa]|uniref:Uncharacterized protein n=1 Tax=Tegillarca granosa TaxID=220873 RepID=A0ABQ9ED63_TEGGR|nr:hypothetical protein KUTeg_020437 [Tegillarca granosa]
MKNDLSPPYLCNLVPLPHHEIHSHNTQGSQNFQSILCRTSFYFNSFLPSVIRNWNDVPNDVKNNILYLSFKNSISTSCKVPFYYNCRSRLGQILHARLRLECSSLQCHLFNRNLVNNPYCRCGLVENAKHFLLFWKIYSHIRLRTIYLLPYVLSINKLLYGDPMLSQQQNTEIFLSVQEFIIQSKRYKT